MKMAKSTVGYITLLWQESTQPSLQGWVGDRCWDHSITSKDIKYYYYMPYILPNIKFLFSISWFYCVKKANKYFWFDMYNFIYVIKVWITKPLFIFSPTFNWSLNIFKKNQIYE